MSGIEISFKSQQEKIKELYHLMISNNKALTNNLNSLNNSLSEKGDQIFKDIATEEELALYNEVTENFEKAKDNKLYNYLNKGSLEEQLFLLNKKGKLIQASEGSSFANKYKNNGLKKASIEQEDLYLLKNNEKIYLTVKAYLEDGKHLLKKKSEVKRFKKDGQIFDLDYKTKITEKYYLYEIVEELDLRQQQELKELKLFKNALELQDYNNIIEILEEIIANLKKLNEIISYYKNKVIESQEENQIESQEDLNYVKSLVNNL